MKKISIFVAVFFLFTAIGATAQTIKPAVKKTSKSKPLSVTDEDKWG